MNTITNKEGRKILVLDESDNTDKYPSLTSLEFSFSTQEGASAELIAYYNSRRREYFLLKSRDAKLVHEWIDEQQFNSIVGSAVNWD